MRYAILLVPFSLLFLGCADPVLPPLQVSAGETITGIVGDTLELTGSSRAKDVIWKIVKRPTFSYCFIKDSLKLTSQFIPDAPGKYQIVLSAKEGDDIISDTLTTQINVSMFLGQLLPWEPHRTFSISSYDGLKALGLDFGYIGVLKAPIGDCAYNFSLIRSGLTPAAVGTYEVRQQIHFLDKSISIDTFSVIVKPTPLPNPSSFQILFREEFDALDDLWLQSSTCCEKYSFLNPTSASTTPIIESLGGGHANLYSGTGSVTLSRSLADLSLENYRYLKIELLTDKFTRNRYYSLDGTSLSWIAEGSEFSIHLGSLKITPRLFPTFYDYYGAQANCYPELSLGSRKITIHYDRLTGLVAVFLDDDPTNHVANFYISHTNNNLYAIELSSKVGIVFRDYPYPSGGHASPTVTGFDYVEISGGN
jgi:hypothetical protein